MAQDSAWSSYIGSSHLIAIVLESGVKTPIDLYGNSAGLAPNAFESPTGFPYTLIYPVYTKGQFQSLMDAIGNFQNEAPFKMWK